MVDKPNINPSNFYLRRRFGGDVNRWRKAAEEIATYENYLRALPLHRLCMLVNEEVSFENPDQIDVDFKIWLDKRCWALEEAITLSLGQNPDLVVWHSIQEFPDRSTLAFQFRRRRELFLRAVASGELWDPIAPDYFASWARRTGLVVPPELRDAFEVNFSDAFYGPLPGMLVSHAALVEASADKDELIAQLRRELKSLRARFKAGAEQAAKADDDLGAREKHTLLKFIFGVAVTKYRYDSTASRSDAVGRVARDLDLAGVHLDHDTIRNWLQEATRYVVQKKQRN